MRAEFEFLNELQFVFKSNDQYHYKSAKMKYLDEQFGDISSDINDLEADIMDHLQEEFIKCSHYYANMIELCAELDTLLAFAAVANENNYVKPKFFISNSGKTDDNEEFSFFKISEARHPLAEIYSETSSTTEFVPNDIESGFNPFYNNNNNDDDDNNVRNKIKVITSPNASGKTIYLKQIGLIIYMSMIGSFVPASEAFIGDIDRILTRISSNDSLTEGQSTFSADVKQIAEALNSATDKSLILIDEFGKGTCHSNGQAILVAIIRYWLNGMKNKQPNENSNKNTIYNEFTSCPHVFISTHFYEIFQQADILFKENAKRIDYLTFDYLFEDEKAELVKQEKFQNYKRKIVFLYKLKKGLTK